MGAHEQLQRLLSLLDAKDYYNGGQTVRTRYPHGSDERAQIVSEAAFWQGQIDREESAAAIAQIESSDPWAITEAP